MAEDQTKAKIAKKGQTGMFFVPGSGGELVEFVYCRVVEVIESTGRLRVDLESGEFGEILSDDFTPRYMVGADR